MLVTVQRTGRTPKATLGQFRLGDTILGVTLEDPPDEGKGPIPAGTYKLVLTYSPGFQMLLPEILHVRGFTDIRIHSGNRSADTKGCVLIGTYLASDSEIGQSRIALGRLLERWSDWTGDQIAIREAP